MGPELFVFAIPFLALIAAATILASWQGGAVVIAVIGSVFLGFWIWRWLAGPPGGYDIDIFAGVTHAFLFAVAVYAVFMIALRDWLMRRDAVD